MKRFRYSVFRFSLPVIFTGSLLLLTPPLQAQEPSFSPVSEEAFKEAGLMTTQEFLNTRAARLFQNGKYRQAIPEFEQLAREYPEDVLILRYIGISYFKMDRYDKAMEIFRRALELEPESAAVHFYLGETFLIQGLIEAAVREYRTAVEIDRIGRYSEVASQRLQTIQEGAEVLIPETRLPKPWNASIEIGYEYDGNATFNPRQGTLASSDDQNAGRYQTEVNADYEFFQYDSGYAAVDYTYSQSLYDDSLNQLNTFSNTAGVSMTHFSLPWDKPFIIQLREAVTHVILEDKFFVFVNSLSSTLIFEPHPKVQSGATYAFTVSEFDDNSARPDVNGRDGISHTVSVFNTFYFNKKKDLRLMLAYDYQHDDTKGVNFTRDVHGGRLVFHFPVIEKIEGELAVRYFHDDRPLFLVETPDGPRRDDVWEIIASLERQVTQQLLLRAFFAYQRAFSRNNAFEYVRAFGGASMTYEM